MRSRLVRRSIAALMALVLALALAGAALWWQRRELAHWWTLRELARLGVAPARVEVEHFDNHRLALRGLRAGAGDELAIDAIDADYTLRQLWGGRVSALRVSGVRLTGEIGPAGARFGGLESIAGRSAEGDAAASDTVQAGLRLPVLPTNELLIDDAHAELATEQGPLRVELSVNAQDREGHVRARADLVAHHALADATAVLDLAGAGDALAGGAAFGLALAPGAGLRLPLSAGTLAQSARLEVAGSDVRVSLAPGPFALTFGEGPEALRLEGNTPQASLRTQIEVGGALAPIVLTASGGELLAPGLGVAARGFDVDVTLGPAGERLSGSFGVRELKDTRRPRRAPDFALVGSVEPRDAALAFELRASEAKQRLVIHAEGSFDPETRSGDAQLRIEPLRFEKSGLQPAQLAPQLAGLFQAVVGSLEATGRVRFGGERTRLTLEVAGRELGFATRLAQVEGLNGTLRFEGPGPFSTPAGQLVSIARIGFGLDLTNGLIAGGLHPGGVVVIEQAEWQIVGGRVRTAGRIDPKATRQAFVLEADALDLAQLLALVDLDGLSGDGLLDGTLPIERHADGIAIQHAIFRARPGGNLRYRPASGAASLRRAGEGFEVLLGAFENLALEKLEIELDGEARGEMQVSLRVVGANPDFQGGRPIHYNLNVESRLADLLRETAVVSKIPQVIEDRLKRFGQPAP